MDEGISVRAITIGVSIFIAIITMTAVLSYYNAAKESVRSIGQGTDISVNYNREIESLLVKASSNYYLNGTDVKNLINYYYGNVNVDINILKLLVVDDKGVIGYENMAGNKKQMYENINNNKSKYNNAQKKLFANQKFRLERINNNSKMTLNIIGE